MQPPLPAHNYIGFALLQPVFPWSEERRSFHHKWKRSGFPMPQSLNPVSLWPQGRKEALPSAQFTSRLTSCSKPDSLQWSTTLSRVICHLRLVPRAAITKCPRLGGFKDRNLLSQGSEGCVSPRSRSFSSIGSFWALRGDICSRCLS